MGGVGSGPHSSAHTEERVKRIFRRGAPGCALTLVQAGTAGARESARLVIAWLIGGITSKLEASITSKSLVITPADIAAALRELVQPIAISQEQDTANELPQPATLDTVNTPE